LLLLLFLLSFSFDVVRVEKCADRWLPTFAMVVGDTLL
jgi:hypothetical protein